MWTFVAVRENDENRARVGSIFFSGPNGSKKQPEAFASGCFVCAPQCLARMRATRPPLH